MQSTASNPPGPSSSSIVAVWDSNAPAQPQQPTVGPSQPHLFAQNSSTLPTQSISIPPTPTASNGVPPPTRSTASPVTYIITSDGKFISSPVTEAPANEQLRTVKIQLGETQSALDVAERLNTNLSAQLAQFHKANDAYKQWETSAHSVIQAHVETEESLKADTIRLNNRVLQLEAEAADLQTRNSSINIAAARFREDLWHSEMRWRDAFNKCSQLEGAVKALKSKHHLDYNFGVLALTDYIPSRH